jgi:hypothetical protein
MIPYSAVVVWQLHGLVEDVHCFFLTRAAAFTLVIERAGERLLQEDHKDLSTLMPRAEELRRSLVAVGFTPIGTVEVESQPILESLLQQFVLEGKTLHFGPYA